MSFFQHVMRKPGESLNSLLMRKAEVNGYGSAHALLREGLLSMKVSYTPDEMERLRELFELKDEELVAGSSDESPYLTQPMFLRSQLSPVCPQCLAEEGVALKAWSHQLVTACPKHQVVLLGDCPSCTQPLSWARRELLKCDCGYDLCGGDTEPASTFASGLSALLAGEDSSSRAVLPAPLNEFGYDPLLPDFLLMLAKASGHMLGMLPQKFRFGISSPVQDSVVLMSHLESLFGEWPSRFDALLQDRLCEGDGLSLSRRIGSWYRKLFSVYMTPSFEFLRERFKTLLAENFDGRLGLRTRALMFGADNEHAMNWFSAAEAARVLGVAPDILANLVVTKKIEGKVHYEGQSRFVAIHRTKLGQIAGQRMDFLSPTEARQRLNLSKACFERFVQAGGLRRYKRDERPALVAGEFLLKDVDDVIQRLKERVCRKRGKLVVIGLQDISSKHGVSNSKVIGVLQDILQGTIRPVAHVESVGGLAGLQFDKAEIEQRVRNNDPDVRLTVDELSRVSGWKSGLIKKWIRGGLLEAVEEVRGRAKRHVIPVSAVIRFQRTYIPTAEVSKQLGIRTLYMMPAWERVGIELAVPPQDMGGGQRGLLLVISELAAAAAGRLRQPTFGQMADQLEASNADSLSEVTTRKRAS